MSEIEVRLEFTPNPNTLKYLTSENLLDSGAANYTDAAKAKEDSPLASQLFELSEDVSGVMIGGNFVTVTLENQDNIHDLNDKIIQSIKDFCATGEKAVTAQTGQDTSNMSETEKKIVEILDRDIRPAVAMDGGDIVFEKFEDGVVYLSMQGSCSGCPSSLMTLKMGVETRLKENIPEVQEVIPV